jgi:hypothetical protein
MQESSADRKSHYQIISLSNYLIIKLTSCV